MRDVFWLLTKEVDIIDICDLLQNKGIAYNCYTEPRAGVQILNGDTLIDFFPMGEEEFDIDDRKLFQDKRIKTVINISYNFRGRYDVKPVLYTLLENIGGVIGNDTDGFEPILELSDIEFFSF